MQNLISNRAELLAPAGNLACALAAYDAGADAVYAGMKRFNARERTENFTAEEMSKLLAYAHKNGRKVYLTFNTLIKESELDDAAEELALLDELRPDALIVQDLGVLRMIRRYFPHLTIHASTQMGLHNSGGLSFADRLGVQRVILERQTTLDELRAMMARKPAGVELEVFIHGALCCCISGTCLLSSWLGGWSGNRGKCKQPCRRRHHSDDGNGFFLSAQDLCTLDIIPDLLDAGVASLKIEGRLRRADYVSNVVSAYRLAIDSAHDPAEFKDALPKCKEILAKTCGRKWSLGYYTGDSASHLIKFDAMGVSGLLCGKVVSRSKNGFTMSAMRRIHVGDSIRIQPRSGDEGPALCVTRMSVNGNPVKRVLKDETCFIHSDKEVPEDGFVYKTGESTDDYARRIAALPLQKPALDLGVSVSRQFIRVKAADFEWHKDLDLQEAGARPLLPETIEREFQSMTLGEFAVGSVSASVSHNPFLPASVFKALRNEFRDALAGHLSAASLAQARRDALAKFRTDYAAAGRTHSGENGPFRIAAAVPRGLRPELPPNSIIVREIQDAPSPHEELLLPFFVNETYLKTVTDELERYFSKGGHVVRISSLHHLALLTPFRKRYSFTVKTCMPLPVCNSMAAAELQALGVDLVQGWLELEKPELEALVRKSPLPVELYRYGRPALLSTRAKINVDGRMSDARGNVFLVRKDAHILTQIFAERVMKLPSVRGTVGEFMDLRHARPGEKDFSTFNFEHTLS